MLIRTQNNRKILDFPNLFICPLLMIQEQFLLLPSVQKCDTFYGMKMKFVTRLQGYCCCGVSIACYKRCYIFPV